MLDDVGYHRLTREAASQTRFETDFAYLPSVGRGLILLLIATGSLFPFSSQARKAASAASLNSNLNT
jgi:hypothetical protein